MTGFIIGIAVLTILSQLPTITGYEPTAGNNKVIQTLNLLANLDQVNLLVACRGGHYPGTRHHCCRAPGWATSAGWWRSSSRPCSWCSSVWIACRSSGTSARFPAACRRRVLPSFSGITFDVVTGALAVAVIILVQGAGVSQSVPNPDGSRRSMSRDFIAQGAANVASGFFRGLPVGGSLSTTALTVISGARTHWAAIFAGLWMALIVMVFPGLVSYVAMPALGALLILASVSTIKPSEALSIWNTGWPSRLASITTFLSTLFLPIQAAVGIGVVLSALLYVNESSTDISVVELVKRARRTNRRAQSCPSNYSQTR